MLKNSSSPNYLHCRSPRSIHLPRSHCGNNSMTETHGRRQKLKDRIANYWSLRPRLWHISHKVKARRPIIDLLSIRTRRPHNLKTIILREFLALANIIPDAIRNITSQNLKLASINKENLITILRGAVNCNILRKITHSYQHLQNIQQKIVVNFLSIERRIHEK